MDKCQWHTVGTFVSFSSELRLQETLERKVSMSSWGGDTIRTIGDKPRVGTALSEGGRANRNIYAAPGSTKGLGAHLKRLYSQHTQYKKQINSKRCSVPRALMSLIWWKKSHEWSAGMEGYRLLRGDRQGRRGGGVARERFDCTVLTVTDDVMLGSM